MNRRELIKSIGRGLCVGATVPFWPQLLPTHLDALHLDASYMLSDPHKQWEQLGSLVASQVADEVRRVTSTSFIGRVCPQVNFEENVVHFVP